MVDILGFLETTQIHLGEVTALVEEQGHDIYQCPQASKPRLQAKRHTCILSRQSPSWSNGKIPRWGGRTYCLEVLKFIDDMVGENKRGDLISDILPCLLDLVK